MSRSYCRSVRRLFARRHRLPLLLMLVFSPACWGSEESDVMEARALPMEVRYLELALEEPSGAAWHAQRGTMLIVSDSGVLAELDSSFTVLNRYRVAGDLEGVSVHPVTGTVFIASERSGAILEYCLEAKRVLRTLVIDFSSHPDFRAGNRGNKSIEGVAVIAEPGDRLALYGVIESGPARMIRLNADVSPAATQQARSTLKDRGAAGTVESIGVVAAFDLKLTRKSDLTFDVGAQQFVVISARDSTGRMVDKTGKISRSFGIPGTKAEGLCFLPNGDGVFVQDTGGAWIAPGLHEYLFGRPALPER